MRFSLTSGAMRRSEQAPLGSVAHAPLSACGWTQIPTFDNEKPLG